MSYDFQNFHFCPCYVEPYAIKASLQKLNKVSSWMLSTDPKAIDHLMVGHEGYLGVLKPL
jgi:hypothetical protein